tara:strand:+ start:2462 stop:3889 length:1428 start_codon:yes stop_codon:yes gene_type:complete
MKISAVKSTPSSAHSIYLFQSIADLEVLKLSDEDQKYLENKFKKLKQEEAFLNSHKQCRFFVKIDSSKKEGYQINESLRLKGKSALTWIGQEKISKVVVQSLVDNLSPIAFAEGMALANYQFLKYYSDAKKRKNSLKEILLLAVENQEILDLNASLNGVFKARDLVNEPVMHLTAVELANEAKAAGEKYGFKVEVLNKKKIEALKMGGLLAVNKGSQDPPTFTIMEHKPAKALNKKPIVLVGKGVVYDTGGLSLKPTAGSMDSMKSDMGGAAAVIGTMISVASSKLPLHIIGLTPATDNRPGEKAYTPGDVIKMYDGSTVEVLNTDAEGRMILADALAYAKKYKPELVIDLATLTGAAAVAIGKYGIVAMGNAKDEVFVELSGAGEEAYERIARFPFWDEYNELLKSSIADVKNIGGREGGAITAGKFLERFTDYPYVHLDIAGPAFLAADNGYRLRGGTGVGVRLLHNYLKNKV